MTITKKTPNKKDPDLEEELEEEEEEEEEKEEPKKKKAAAKNNEEEMPQWAKQILKLLTPNEQPQAKEIPTPKPPAAKQKEEEGDLERESQEEDKKPQMTFLNWFW